MTGVKSSGTERIGGLRDGSMSWTMFLDITKGVSPYWTDDLYSLPRTDTVAAYFRGTAIGNASACINGKQVNYDPTRDASGNLSLKVDVQANAYGLDWGKQLTAGLRTDTTATAGTALDNTASSSNGGQAYLQVTAFTGTGVDITVEHSADNSTWATLADFGTISAVGAQRVAVTGTVDEYLRATTGTGTFTTVTFAVAFTRNETAVSF